MDRVNTVNWGELTHMTWNPNARRLVPAALVGLALVAACQDDRSAIVSVQPAPEFRVAVEASSLSAAPGTRIAVAIRGEAASGAPVGGLQGTLRFDASRLRYVGQSLEGPQAITNNEHADAGELRFINVDAGAIPARAAEYVFEVRGSDYARTLRLDFYAAVLEDGTPIRSATVARSVMPATDLAVRDDARPLTVEDWNAKLYPNLQPGPARSPGSYVLNLQYGDITLDGAVNVFDAQEAKRVAVGINALIAGTDSPNRDRVVAANVYPSNLPGLGEVGDANPPGLEADGSRVIDVFDAQRIAREAANIDQAVVGELIPGRGPVTTARQLITSDITVDRLFVKDTVYEIQGRVKVRNGATLTIQAGTRVEGGTPAPGQDVSTLIIQRDGRIVAIGTPLEPIVMSCTSPTKVAGCWGGLVIAGNSSINDGTPSSPVIAGRSATGNCIEKLMEGTTDVYFGGCNPADSSGVLKYLRVEYGGFILSANNELNGISAGALGNHTVIDYIDIHSGLDDCFELFGGTVNVKHLLCTANQDDNFDISFGWSGMAQFVIAQQDSTNGDKGIEADNSETAPFTQTPYTTGQIWNFTLVGQLDPTSNTGVAGNNVNDALHLRRGTTPFISNLLAQGYPSPLDLDDNQTCAQPQQPEVQHSLFVNLASLGNSDSGDPTNCAGGPGSGSDAEQLFLAFPAKGNQVGVSGSVMIAPYNYMTPDFRPLATLPAGVSLVGATPPNNGFFDVTATYIGAVPQANSNASNIPWYSGWTRGWQNPTTP